MLNKHKPECKNFLSFLYVEDNKKFQNTIFEHDFNTLKFIKILVGHIRKYTLKYHQMTIYF